MNVYLLPGHNLSHRYLTLEDEPTTMRQEVLLREIGLCELEDVRCEILRQHGMLPTLTASEQSIVSLRTRTHPVFRDAARPD